MLFKKKSLLLLTCKWMARNIFNKNRLVITVSAMIKNIFDICIQIMIFCSSYLFHSHSTQAPYFWTYIYIILYNAFSYNKDHPSRYCEILVTKSWFEKSCINVTQQLWTVLKFILNCIKCYSTALNVTPPSSKSTYD